MEYRQINQLMPNNIIDGGMFKYIPTYGDITALEMGILYSVKSGEKLASSLATMHINSETGKIYDTAYESIGRTLTAIYKENWNKIYDAYTKEYEPLENYNMIEEGSDTNSGSDVITDVKGNKRVQDIYGQDKITNVMGERNSQDIIGERMDSAENQVSAFNSPTYQDNNKDVNILGEQTNNHKDNQYIDTTTKDSRTDTHTEDGYTDINTTQHGLKVEHKLTKRGNLGVTTSQQMLQSELELRKYDFIKQIFNDIDTYLCLRIY